MKKRRKFYFTTILEERGGCGQYAHFMIEFWAAEQDHAHRLGLVLRWQANKEDKASEDNAQTENTWKEGWSDWYALNIKAESTNMEQWNTIKAVMKQVSRQWNGLQPQPAEVLRQLARSLTFEEGAQDERTRQVTPLDEIPALDLNRYIDDYDQYENGGFIGGGCRFDCLAHTADEAKVKIAAKIAKRGQDDVLIRFLKAGKPVKRCGDAPLSLPKTGLAKLNQALL